MGGGPEGTFGKWAGLLLVLMCMVIGELPLLLAGGFCLQPDRQGEMTKGREGQRPQFPVLLIKIKTAFRHPLCIVLPRQVTQTPFLLGLGKFLPFFPLPCHISFI